MSTAEEDGLERDQLIALMVAEKDAALHQRGSVRVIAWSDVVDRDRPAVELCALDDSGELVVEHTRIESYPDQVKDQAAMAKIFPRGGIELPEHPLAGHHTLSVRPGALAAVPFAARSRVEPTLAAWVREHIDDVPWPHQPGTPIFLVGSDPTIPLEWFLWRMLPDSVGLVGPYARVTQISFLRPPTLEAMRIERLARSLDDKVPKLLDAAATGRRSVLVLEERDTALSSPMDVSRALEVAAAGRDLPDVIYLLNTRMGDPLLCVIWEDGQWAHQTDDPFRWRTFEPSRASQLNMMPVTWL